MAGTGIAPARDWRETPLARIISPMQRFIHSETSGGLVLIAATILALILANSPLSSAYMGVLKSYIGISVGPFELRENVLHWINDGLMALFFFVVGLELKREAIVGELANPRNAILPIVAAIGGAAIPALIYVALNAGGPGSAGWGVPMATDIAFALGVLALLGDRAPFALKVFLTAVAVIDDLLAVLIIALFYSGELNYTALGIGFIFLALLAVTNLTGVRRTIVYVALGLIVWLAFLQSGVHATIAGVLVALTIPARNRINPDLFLERARGLLAQFERTDPGQERMMTDERQQSAVYELEAACEEVQAPLQKIEHALHPWVAFGVIPIFALANAGVQLSPDALGGDAMPIILGVTLGLVLGKPIGIMLTSWLLVRFSVVALPRGVTWRQVLGVSFLAGIGFTMSLFIATLAFGDGARLEAAKIGILGASLIAGLAGYGLLRSGEPKSE
ncbi:MAG TPA: Na+/H+ antiporter NhaA [Roseiflexaceae bacterium]|nr:Na+/H+ antiporter NhaA [Roseiflexaceae bacterium]HMP41658.1 Na+/H+ antiporter NhaA [Roseiflexaceae bacterium]